MMSPHFQQKSEKTQQDLPAPENDKEIQIEKTPDGKYTVKTICQVYEIIVASAKDNFAKLIIEFRKSKQLVHHSILILNRKKSCYYHRRICGSLGKL